MQHKYLTNATLSSRYALRCVPECVRSKWKLYVKVKMCIESEYSLSLSRSLFLRLYFNTAPLKICTFLRIESIMLQIGRCVTELCRFYGRTAIFQLNNYNFSLSIFLPSLISYGKTEPITTCSGKVSRTVKLHWYWLRKSDSTKCFQQRSHTCFRKFSDCETSALIKLFYHILWIQKMD